MTVIADKGLVGHVISVTDNTAKVQVIVDSASSVSAMISTSSESIICRGSVVTSGIGGIYPKGITIGTIKQVVNTKNITDRYAIVETAVDFSKLYTVLVIK